jgi:hypothetical protein
VHERTRLEITTVTHYFCRQRHLLLFRRMDMLQIDRGNLMQDEPPLYREVQGVTRCARASRTARQRD